MAEGARARLRSWNKWRIDKEEPASLLRIRTSRRQRRGRASSCVNQEPGRTKKWRGLFELGDAKQVCRCWLRGRLVMRLYRMECLRRKIRFPAIQHQNRVKRGGVERGRCASPKDYGPRPGIVPHADIRRQGDLDEDRRIGQDTVDAVTLPIVASVEQKQGIERVQPIPPLGVLGRNGSCV